MSRCASTGMLWHRERRAHPASAPLLLCAPGSRSAGDRIKCSTLRDYMTDEKEAKTPGPAGSSTEEVALELMRFIAQTTGIGKSSTGAGFAGKSLKTPEEQVDTLLQLY